MEMAWNTPVACLRVPCTSLRVDKVTDAIYTKIGQIHGRGYTELVGEAVISVTKDQGLARL